MLFRGLLLGKVDSAGGSGIEPDFMFHLSDQQVGNLKSQFETSSWGGIRRANPYAFTEQVATTKGGY